MARIFAIVAEGKTDQPVIENILAGYFADDPEPVDVRYTMPEHEEPVGWKRVLRFLTDGEYDDALQFADYVIVHLDTDSSGQPGYNVPHQVPGNPPRSLAELVAAVHARLETLIGPVDLAKYPDQFLFAVCVHELECWLLPLHRPDRPGDLVNGAPLVSHGLRLADRPPLSKSDVASYREASLEYRDRPTLLAKGVQHPSLQIFLDNLANLPPEAPPTINPGGMTNS